MIIAIDFDGTCVMHEFPKVGKDIGAVPILKELVAKGHKLILFTTRSHEQANVDEKGNSFDVLQDAINWFKERDIPLYGVNKNPDQNWFMSRKVYANMYIDNAGLGCPLKYDMFTGRNYVDWEKVREILEEKKIL